MRLLLKTSLTTLLFLWGGLLMSYSQLSFGGTPLSSSHPFTDKDLSDITTVFTPSFNSDDLRSTASWQQQQRMGAPLFVGKKLPVHQNLLTLPHEKTTVGTVDVRRFVLQAPDAKAVSLYFSELQLAPKQKLYLMTPSGSHVLGAFTSETNPDGGRMATQYVPGERLVVQLETPSGTPTPNIQLQSIGYFYNVPEQGMLPRNIPGEGASELCQVNVNCPEGKDVQDIKNGIVHIITSIEGNIAFCSGTLLNNTAQDNRPLIITAAHCSIYRDIVQGKVINTMETSEEEFKDWVFVFHYERPECRDNYFFNEQYPSLAGSKRLVTCSDYKESDGLLLELLHPIPYHYGAYFNGWDRTGNPEDYAVGLHHPRGDAMKIVTINTPLDSGTWAPADGYSVGDRNAHWTLRYAKTENGHGVTDPGSSGSGLFNAQNRLIGTLTGGAAECKHPKLLNFYGKLSFHWNHYADKGPGKEMATILDPKGNGTAETLDGKKGGERFDLTDLKATLKDGKVTLEWPLIAVPNHMRIDAVISRDGKVLGEVTPTGGNNHFVDNDPQSLSGIATYKVYFRIANFDGEEILNTQPRYASIYLHEPAVVSDLKVTPSGDQATLTWQPPLLRQLITQAAPGTEAQRSQLEAVSYLYAPSSLNEIYLGTRHNGLDLKPVHNARISAVRFFAARGEKLHKYELFIRNGNKVTIDDVVGGYTPAPDDRTTAIKQEITASYVEGDELFTPLITPMAINSNEMLTVAVKVLSAIDLQKKSFVVYDKPAAPESVLRNVFSFDNRYWMPTSWAYPTPTNMAVAIDFVVDNAPLDAPVRTDGVIPSGVLPAAFPEVEEYIIKVDGVEVAHVPAGTHSYTISGYKAGQTVAVQPKYKDGRIATSAEQPLAWNETPHVYPTVVEDLVQVHRLPQRATIKIVSLTGETMVTTTNQGQHSLSIDANQLPAGVYILQIETPQDSYTYKITKR